MDINGIHIQIKLLCMNIRLNYIAQFMHDLRKAAGILLQMYFPAFNMAHIQNIIDQAQQMIARCHNLPEIFLHKLPVINARKRK